MANRYFTQFFYTFFKKPVMIAGKIPLSSAAAVGSVSIKGVASVVKTGTGVYEVTLEDQYYAVESILAGISDSTQNLHVEFQNIDLPSKTFEIVTKVAGTVANVSDACDIYIQAVLSNSSIN